MVYRVFVGKLSDRTSESSVRRAFEEFGDVKNVEVKGNFGFVYFETEAQANNAIDKLNHTELDGSNITVEMARSNNPNKDSTGKLIRRLENRILVRNVNTGLQWTDLKDWARGVGEVTYTNVFERDGQTFGLVEYRLPEQVEKALTTLEESPLKGASVRVEKADPEADYHNIPPNRGPGRGGGGGGRGDRGYDRGGYDRSGGRDGGRDRRDRSRSRDRRDDRGGYSNGGGRYDSGRGGGYDNRDNYRDDYDRRPPERDYRDAPRSPPRNPPPQGPGRSRSRDRGGSRSRHWDGPPSNGGGDYRGGSRDYGDRGGGYGGQGGGYPDDRRGGGPPQGRYYDDRGYDRR